MKPPPAGKGEFYGGYLRPMRSHDGNDVVLEVECGNNRGLLYLSRLCQGSRGACIQHGGSWLTPNQFQQASGRQTAKDWKRSIRHAGRSFKLLLTKGLLNRVVSTFHLTSSAPTAGICLPVNLRQGLPGDRSDLSSWPHLDVWCTLVFYFITVHDSYLPSRFEDFYDT